MITNLAINPMRSLKLILLGVATVLLLLMLNQLGWANLGRQLLRVGYYWPLLLVPYGLVNYLGAVSWNCLLPSRDTRPSLTRLFYLRLAGESLNQLTPTASMGGEPYKALRLKADGVQWEEATASVVIQKGIIFLSLVLYIFLGLAMSAFIVDLNAAHLGALSLAALVLGGAGVAFVVVQNQGPCVSAIRVLERFGLCPSSLKAKEQELAGLDASLSGFYREYPGRGFLAFGLFFLSWLVHGMEVYLIFQLLGHPIGWDFALCLDGLVVLVTSLGFMIPASLGVQDGGTILLSLGFNLGATLGGAFTIMRRIREAFWLSIGLVVLAREK